MSILRNVSAAEHSKIVISHIHVYSTVHTSSVLSSFCFIVMRVTARRLFEWILEYLQLKVRAFESIEQNLDANFNYEGVS